MDSKKADEPVCTEAMGKRCPSCGWRAEIISTFKDGTVTVACANCLLDKTPKKSKSSEERPICSYCEPELTELFETLKDGKFVVICDKCKRVVYRYS